MDDTKHFGNYLKVLLKKYGIKHSELADALNVSRQYVSSIITNKKTPSRDCFNAILTFLDKYLIPTEEQNLANKLIYAKTGINNPLKQLMETEAAAVTADELVLLEDFRKLGSRDRFEVIKFVRQKEASCKMLKNTEKQDIK